MSETVNGVAFVALALVMRGRCGRRCSSTRNVVHAAFWLLEVSVAAAGVFFAAERRLRRARAAARLRRRASRSCMHLHHHDHAAPTAKTRSGRATSRALGAALAVGVLRRLIAFALVGWHGRRGRSVPPTVPRTSPRSASCSSRVDGWALPFEIASLILTAALVGAVWWSREGDE